MSPDSPVYLDCNASAPIDLRVQRRIADVMTTVPGNSENTAHKYGEQAAMMIHEAAMEIAAIAHAQAGDVVFTNGATESNNLAILGLASHRKRTSASHIVSTSIEHKSVLEPLRRLADSGHPVTLVDPTPGGWVSAAQVMNAVQDDTVLVSVQHCNNETGIVQPISDIAKALADHPAALHCDAAQGFGKSNEGIDHPRLDLISVSGHKFYGPQGIGALIVRGREGGRPRAPLSSIMAGGGQQGGLRPGTQPTALIAGLGYAAKLARAEHDQRIVACLQLRLRLTEMLAPLNPILIGDQSRCQPHVMSIAIEGLDSDMAMVLLRDIAAVSTGAACNAGMAGVSHVLQAMSINPELLGSVLRFSWCHHTPEPDWQALRRSLQSAC